MNELSSDKATVRHKPKQSRSKEIVTAIIQAGLLVLQEAGADKLTTTRIAHRAGVSVGSLYRYFSKKEDIIAAIYEEKTKQELKFVEAITPWLDELTKMHLEAAIRTIVVGAITRHRHMIELHKDFYLNSHQAYSLGQKLPPELLKCAIMKILARDKEKLNIENSEVSAFLIVRGLSGILRIALDENPPLIASDTFAEELITMFMRYIGVSQSDDQIPATINAPDDCPAWVLLS